MKISVIMPSLDQRRFIGPAIRSVLGQAGPFDLELIVVDGGSADGTVELLAAIDDPRLRWTSEPDGGQGDAVNKGLARATGEVIGWLNSDDLYRPGCLAAVARVFAERGTGNSELGTDWRPEREIRSPEPEFPLPSPLPSSDFRVPSSVQWAYGQCRIIDESGRPIRRPIAAYKHLLGRQFCMRRLLCANFISQPATFFRREFARRAGPINPDLHYVMDYEYWLRLARIAEPTPIRRLLADFRLHGASKSVRGFTRQFAEQEQVARRFAAGRPWLMRAHRINRRLTVAGYRLLARLNA